MPIKKNPAKANIGPKKQVKATFAECTAENPLKCKYHGLKAFDNLISSCLAKNGIAAAFVTDKVGDGYELRFSPDTIFGKAMEDILNALHEKGLNLVFKGTHPETGALVYKAQEDDNGITYETPANEAELEDADTLSSADAPKDNTESIGGSNDDDLLVDNELDADLLDNFDDLEGVTAEATEDLEAELLGNSDYDDVLSVLSDGEHTDTELTDEDIKNLVAIKGITEKDFKQNPDLIDVYKAIITIGKNPGGKELTAVSKAWWNDLIAKTKSANEDGLPALKVLKDTMKGMGETQESPAPVAGYPTDLSAEMEKCQKKWDKLWDTAVNGKQLKGTQYWAETIAPIVEDYNEAISANNVVKAFDAVYDLKNAVKDAPDNAAQEEPPKQPFTDEEFKEALQKYFEKTGYMPPTEVAIEIWKQAALSGTTNGEPLSEHNQKQLYEFAKTAGAKSSVGKAIKETLAKLNPDKYGKKTNKDATYLEGGDATDDGLTTEEIADFFKKCGYTEGIMLSEENLAATKETLETGKWLGKPLTKNNKNWYAKLAKIVPNHKVANAINKMLSADKKTHKAKKKVEVKEALAEALSGNGEIVVSEDMLKPLEHDDSKFPQNITQDEIDEVIKKGKKLGGHGGLCTRLVEIDGKKYVCKAATGTGASVIRNGYNADMAYRAGGVYAPDSKLYDFGDGKVYKLSEFITGKRLIDVWKDADETTREGIRKELLKGYPLDALFSNYDVLGTSPEDSITVTIQGADGKPQKTHVAFNNIMIGDDGHAYRVDNDGSFAMMGTGGGKSSGGGGFASKVASEKWGYWQDRQWIDDFRTLRRNEKNLGIFDRYSTADVFISAGNINLDAVVGTLPKGLQKALEKPLYEMKQMTWRAVNISLGGYKNNGFVSMALDASYEASKRGLRELSAKGVSWNDSGFGKYKSHWGNYSPQPFGENPPEQPKNPATALAGNLKNDEYTGAKIGSIIFSAAKTINYHGGEKKFDADGNPIGNPMGKPDYKPNAAKIADWEKIDRDKLAELAKTDDNAKILLGLYDTIAYSKENEWKKPIGLVPSGLTIQSKLANGYLSPTEKKVHEDMEGAIEEYNSKMAGYRKELAEYEKRKSAHKKKEEEKAKAAGGSPYHNFHDFAKAMMEEGIDTDGIAHRVQTNGIKPIESSMSSQKDSSYAEAAVKWKVREMMALGFMPEEILEMAVKKNLYNGSYYKTCIENHLLPHKDEWDRDMASQAMYLGMNMVKMENEHNDLYDKGSGVVFLNRNIGKIPQGLTAEEKEIYSHSATTGWVGPHVDSAADCMQFEANWWHAPYKQVYAVPLSRIVCCANNEKADGGGYGFGSEQEYVGNLFNLPCWVYHDDQGLTWKGAIDEAKKSSGMKGFLTKLASRLGIFNTHAKK